MSDIFVSHSERDKAAAERVVEWLSELNYYSVFSYLSGYYGIRGGEGWEKRLYDQIRRSAALVPLVSPNWMKSKWCFVEFAQARALGKSIIPLRIADCDSGRIISNIQHIDISGAEAPAKVKLALALKGAGLDESFSWHGENPYPGLLFFDEPDAGVFFGRQEEIQACRDKLGALGRQDARLLLILGASGSGKSSLMRAGVLPRLRRSQNWCVLGPIIPDQEVSENLTKVFAAALDWELDRVRERVARALSERDINAAPLLEMISEIEHAARPCRPTPLLAIDQAEEALRAGNPGDRFLHLLRALLEQSGTLAAVATMRSHSFDQFQRHPARFERYEPFSLDLMPIERFRKLIEEPAARAHIDVESELIDRIEADARTPDIKTANALPLLAFTLHHLYETDPRRVLTLAKYNGLRGIKGAVRKRAEQAFAAKASEQEREAFFQAFVPHLVDIDEDGGFVRRRARLEDLPVTAHRLIERFVDERLLTSSEENGTVTIDVAHESLFQTWEELHNRLSADRQKLILLNELRRQADAWSMAGGKKGRREALKLWGQSLKQIRELAGERRFTLRTLDQKYLSACIGAANQRAIFAWALLALFLVLSSSITGASYSAYRNLLEAQDQEALVSAGRADDQLQAGLPKEAMQLALQALPRAVACGFDEPDTEEAGRVLEAAIFRDHGDFSFTAHKASINDVAFHPQARDDAGADATRDWIATASDDGTAVVWDLQTGSPVVRFDEHSKRVRTVQFSPDGELVVTASDDGTARIWSDQGTSRRVLGDRDGYELMTSAHFSSDGQKVVTSSDDGRARIWDVSSGRLALKLGHGPEYMSWAEFGPDGTSVLTASNDGMVRIWDLVTAAERVALDEGGQWIGSASYSGDGARAVTAAADGASVWDIKGGKKLLSFKEHAGLVNAAAFSPKNGKMVVTASGDGTAKVFEAVDGPLALRHDGAEGERPDHPAPLPRVRAELQHRGNVLSARFSPEGQRIVTVGSDGTVKIWWVRTFDNFRDRLAFAQSVLEHDGTKRTSDDDEAWGTQMMCFFGQIFPAQQPKPTPEEG